MRCTSVAFSNLGFEASIRYQAKAAKKFGSSLRTSGELTW